LSDIRHLLVEQILDAKSEGRKLEIVGHGSKQFLGRRSTGTKFFLDEHNGVVSYNPTELVITVRAGTSIDVIDQVLSENGQMLASDPPKFDGKGSIGGSLACNLSGPGRPWCGSLRDSVLGVTIVDGNGQELNFGGQVMKNVAGYDVSRLQAGAMGCLGVISEVSLKVMPRPDAMSTTVSIICNPMDALKYINGLCGTSLPITAACWESGKQYIRFQGAGSAVKKATLEVLRSRPESAQLDDGGLYWKALRDQSHPHFGSDGKVWRLSVGPTSEFGEFEPGILDWGGAQRWINAPGRLENMVTHLKAGVGEISIFRGGDGSEEVFHPMDEARRKLHQRLKSAFDPDHLFNPGRLYGWL